MNELRQSAILLSLIEHLKARGSWCGETHVQKGTYFLKELMGVPLNFNFILHKYGPYSFDLSDELVAMRADSLIRLDLNPPYGPSLTPGDATAQVKKQFPRTLEKFEDQIAFIANQLGEKNVSDLEALSTALYVLLNEGKNLGAERRAQLLLELKPHITPELALNAIKELDTVVSECRSKALQPKQEATAL